MNDDKARLAVADERVAELRMKAFELTPHEQYRLAFFIAENVGYVLTEEPEHPDSPHARSAVHSTDEEALALVMNTLERLADTARDGLHGDTDPDAALCEINNLARDVIDALAKRTMDPAPSPPPASCRRIYEKMQRGKVSADDSAKS